MNEPTTRLDMLGGCDSKWEDVVQHRPGDFNLEAPGRIGEGRREKEGRMDKVGLFISRATGSYVIFKGPAREPGPRMG